MRARERERAREERVALHRTAWDRTGPTCVTRGEDHAGTGPHFAPVPVQGQLLHQNACMHACACMRMHRTHVRTKEHIQMQRQGERRGTKLNEKGTNRESGPPFLFLLPTFSLHPQLHSIKHQKSTCMHARMHCIRNAHAQTHARTYARMHARTHAPVCRE